MNTAILTVTLLAIGATAANARCPTLTGYAAFKRCFVAANSQADQQSLRLQFETMLAEDLARARSAQYRNAQRPVFPPRPQALSHAEDTRAEIPSAHRDSGHRDIAAEMERLHILRQLDGFAASRARNEFRVEQGRARSQDLLYGTQGNRF